MKRKASPNVRTAQNYINTEAIEGGILYTVDRNLFMFLFAQGRDNSLLAEEEHQITTEALASALAQEHEPWQLLSVPRTVAISGMVAELDELRSQTDNRTNLMLLDGESAALEDMARQGAKEPMLLIKLWVPAVVGADRILRERAAALQDRLSAAGITAHILDDPEIRHICMIYANLGVWQPLEDADTEVPKLIGQRRRWRRMSDDECARQELLRDITPVGGLFFGRNYVEIGNAVGRCYGVTQYPSELPYGWAVSLTSATDCITCITFAPGNTAEIGDALSREVSRANREAATERDARSRKEHERKASDADRLLDDLDGANKTIGYLSIVCMPFADSQENLKNVCDQVTARYAAKRMRLRVLAHLQQESFRHLSPYYTPEKRIREALDRVVPLDVLMGGYPMTANIIRDDHGLYFGRTPDRGVITLDLLQRNKERPNGNGIITGQSGTGKSTALKHILLTMYMRGVKVVVIDPEREFRDICKTLDGSWWDAGGGKAKINILQVRPIPPDSEDDKQYQSEGSDLAHHLQSVMMILQYKLNLNALQQGLVTRYLIELYRRFGITMDTDTRGIPADRYPTMHDLYELLVSAKSTNIEDSGQLRELIILLEDMCVGADAVLWDGHTTVDLDSNLVVIDTNRLYSATKQNRAAQYYNILLMALDVATADKDTPYMIIADEAQILFDPELPRVGEILKTFAERLRKYEGCLWLAFHSLNGLLDPNVSAFGQAVIDEAVYKLLFGTDGKNLADAVELFHLTPAERRVLAARRRGCALCSIGPLRIQVNFELPKYKLDVIGRGGGR